LINPPQEDSLAKTGEKQELQQMMRPTAAVEQRQQSQRNIQESQMSSGRAGAVDEQRVEPTVDETQRAAEISRLQS